MIADTILYATGNSLTGTQHLARNIKDKMMYGL